MNDMSPHKTVRISQTELARIAEVINKISGIQLTAEKVTLAQARLSRRLRENQMKNYSEYCDFIESDAGEHEVAELLSALTTNVTKFFRENHHFEDIKQNLLPQLWDKAKSGRPVRFWSAACSTGEEPYSLAMTILETWPDAHNMNVKVLATDIDPKVVEQARNQSYTAQSVQNIPSSLTSKYLEMDSSKGSYQISERVRSMVTFNTLNLHANWPMKGKFDAIMCRNVAIYFSPEDTVKLWNRFAGILNNDGRLYIGHSERIEEADCRSLDLCGITTYQKV